MAQYRKIAEGVQYTVHYQDSNGIEISSPIVGTANLGAEVTLYARTVDGYALRSNPGAAVTIDQADKQIVFLYDSTAENTTNTIITPGTTTVITVGGNTNTVTVPSAGSSDTGAQSSQGTGGQAAGTTAQTADEAGNTPSGGMVTAPEEQVPLAEDPAGEETQSEEEEKIKVEDEEVPLAENPAGTEKTGISPLWYVGGGILLIALIAGVIVFCRKKRKI